jgi:hypothetical protein
MESKIDVSKKIELVKVSLYKKEINVKENRHLDVVQNKKNKNTFSFGENIFLVLTEQEREEFVLSEIEGFLEPSFYSFSTISNVLNVDIGDVHNFFLADILIDNDIVTKEKEDYFVNYDGLVSFLDKKISISYFVIQLTQYTIVNKAIDAFLGYEYVNCIDGFYVYDLTDERWHDKEYLVF